MVPLTFPVWTLADNLMVLVVIPPAAVVTMAVGEARVFLLFATQEKAMAFRAVEEFKGTRPVQPADLPMLRDWIAKRGADYVVVDPDPARPDAGPFLHAAEV